MTQQKLADLLKCSKSTISLYETGDTVPDAKNIVRLCDIFGVSCDYLLCQTNYRRAEDERLTIEEMGYSEKAAQALDDLDFIQLLNHSGHIKFPFSPKESFNLICEDSRFKELMLLICEAYQFKIAAARFDPKSVDEASNLEIGGCRAMLFAIGEACAPVGEMAEVYLQRASDLLKAIVRDFPTEDPETGEEYQMFVSGNIYNPILKTKIKAECGKTMKLIPKMKTRTRTKLILVRTSLTSQNRTSEQAARPFSIKQNPKEDTYAKETLQR